MGRPSRPVNLQDGHAGFFAETAERNSHFQRFAPNGEFVEPDQTDATCPVIAAKINPFAFCPNQIHKPGRSVPMNRGAFRDRHERWARDAVDALARKTSAFEADGEVVWA
jgi:hypothetical protein